MNCKEFKKNLPMYFDKVINPDERKDYDAHLSSCATCSLLFNKVSDSLSHLKQKREITEQAFYYTRLKQKMINQVEKKSFIQSALFKKSIQLSAYLASIAIAVFIGILIGSNSEKVQYSDINYDSKDYLKSYVEYQYLNDFEMENEDYILLTDSIE